MEIKNNKFPKWQDFLNLANIVNEEIIVKKQEDKIMPSHHEKLISLKNLSVCLDVKPK